MSKSKPKPPITDLLRNTIADSGVPLLVLQRRTGVKRASIARFVRGETSLRLDKADALAEFFGLKLVRQQDRT
jgi:plasmid maintenance system antidote protein VapI